MKIVSSWTPAPLSFTDNAAKKIKILGQKEGDDELKLRLFITGGGCSGFQYGFSFDRNVASDDTVIKREGAILVVDPMSLQYLRGCMVDYLEGLEGSRFIVNNPGAKTTCGCGLSFSI